MLEETGLIVEVGAWALGQALADYRRWQAAGYAAPRVAVNVSAVQVYRDDFVETVLKAVESAGDIPEALKRDVVAEGVETAEQGKILTQLGCEQGQGFYYSRPVPAAAIEKMLEPAATPARAVA